MLFSLKTKTRVLEQDFKVQFPNVSFPNVLNNIILEPYYHTILVYPPLPKITSVQKIKDAGDKFVNGEWRVEWKVCDKTIEEVQLEEEAAFAHIRVQRNALLSASDWTQGVDVEPKLQAKWAAYRKLLKDFPKTIVDPTLPCEFPKTPV